MVEKATGAAELNATNRIRLPRTLSPCPRLFGNEQRLTKPLKPTSPHVDCISGCPWGRALGDKIATSTNLDSAAQARTPKSANK